jgi:hypothetical protein
MLLDHTWDSLCIKQSACESHPMGMTGVEKMGKPSISVRSWFCCTRWRFVSQQIVKKCSATRGFSVRCSTT